MMLRHSHAFARAVTCLGGLFLSLLTSTAAEEKAKEDSGARLMVQDGHFSAIISAVFSPDGKLILTGGDTTARLWDVETGKQIQTLEEHTDRVTSVAFSPDSKRVVTGSEDNTARLWEVQTGKQLHIFEGHTSWVHGVAFSPDGQFVLTGSKDRTARLWDVQSGKQRHNLQGHSAPVESVAFSPDGRFILTGSRDKTARLWDVQTGKQFHNLQGHTLGVRCVAFSPDSKLALTGSEDRTARLWDVATGNCIHDLQGHAGGVHSVACSPDGKRVFTCSAGRTARLWDVATGKPSRDLEGHSKQVISVAFSPDGKVLLTGSLDETARLWDVQTGKPGHTLQGHYLAVQCVAFSPDGKRALTTSSAAARLWDVQTGKLIQYLQGNIRPVGHVGFNSDGKRALTNSSGTALLWDLQIGKVIRGFRANRVVLSPDGKLILASSGETALVRDVQTGKHTRTFKGHTRGVYGLAFSPDGKLVLTGSDDKTARLWDLHTGKPIHNLQGHTNDVRAVAFSPDGKLVLTGSHDRTARLWDAQTGQPIRTFEGIKGRVECVAFSPDGKLALAGSADKTAWLWDVQTGNLIHDFPGHIGLVHCAAFSPDGKIVITGSDEKLARLWDVQTGKGVSNLQGHTGGVTSAAFSPDGKFVLTGSRDKTTRLWDVQTGKELCKILSFADETWAVVDPQGRYDASNGGDVDGLHWIVDLEPIALNQLKERYYDPGLLAKIVGFNKEPLREVKDLEAPKLHPGVEVTEPTTDNPKLTITLTNRGGGIGRVVVKLNGKEVFYDARPEGTDPKAPKLKLEIDLRGDRRVKPGGQNVIEVQAFNAEGYLRSRGMERLFEAEGKEEKEPPELWAVVVGVSKYGNSNLELRYAAKDAEDFAHALQVASTRLFGKDKVHRTLLTTAQTSADDQPTRKNLVKALEAAQKAKPSDVVVIYLAGHGVNQGGQDGDFYYLTRDAQSADLKDPEVRRQTALSSAELTELLKKIPAQKQVLILDTCASGAAIKNLTEKRDVPGSQVRALERVKDRTGLHILAGCASDAVSYEATRYGQGVLTYSLLLGMRGAKLREGEYVDVMDLFSFASDKVPELARDIGGVQRPVIASPRGSSFDIGRVTGEDQEKIPLQKVRPLVVQASFQEEARVRDNLGLGKRVNDRLRAASSSGRGAALVYVEAAEFPGAVEVRGRYKLAENKVTMSVTLFLGEKDLAAFQVEGDKDKLDDLAGRLVAEIEKRLAGGMQ
jgi:WD40 repeat protein